jgi:hypothetical protein
MDKKSFRAKNQLPGGGRQRFKNAGFIALVILISRMLLAGPIRARSRKLPSKATL